MTIDAHSSTAEYEPSEARQSGFEGRSSGGRRAEPVLDMTKLSELSDPAAAINRTCLLTGFDPVTGLATLQFALDGQQKELTALVRKDDPMYRATYQVLMTAMQDDRGPRELHLRLNMPTLETEFAQILMAVPHRRDANSDRKFNWKGVEAKWTPELDRAVDLDFDRRADAEASSYLSKLLLGEDKEGLHESIAKAKSVFMEEAQAVGLQGDLDTLFSQHAKQCFADIVGGGESVRGKSQTVRYDTRYSFSQQCAHVKDTDADSIASALANYACQKGVALSVVHKAMSDFEIGDGKRGSLAMAHQHELRDQNCLLAPNPALDSHNESYAAYSALTMRNAVAANLAGMMDAANVPAARPELDSIEHEKKFGDLHNSKHKQTLEAMPPEAKAETDPQKRAGAYLGVSAKLDADYRETSRLQVVKAQEKAAPMFDPKRQENPNVLGAEIRKGVRAVEDWIGVL